MMLKTKLFIGKTMAKKFYGDAMKSMKELSGKTVSKTKTFGSKCVRFWRFNNALCPYTR